MKSWFELLHKSSRLPVLKNMPVISVKNGVFNAFNASTTTTKFYSSLFYFYKRSKAAF